MAAARPSAAGRPAPPRPGPPACRATRRSATAARAAASGRDEEPELDVAVFRFTLGIPGFDDALIPRVVGALGAALLALNHVLTDSAVSGAQLRTEALGAALAAVALAAPSLEARLKEADPGRGRRPLPEALDGAAAAFAIASDLPDTVKEELAWASFSLMKNSNICGLAVVWRGRAVLCRGLLAASVAAAGGGDASLAALSAAWPQRWAGSGGAAEYWRERREMRAAGVATWAFVPEGAEGLLLQPLQALECSSSGDGGGGGGGVPEGALVLLCDRARALGRKERLWAAALAAKLGAALRDSGEGAGS